MGHVLDLKRKKETSMEASTSKQHTSFTPMVKDKHTRPESKHEGKFKIEVCKDEEDMDVDIINCNNDEEDVEVDLINCKNDEEDVEVDIINCTSDDECVFVQSHSDDATASSSSFDDTNFDVGNCGYESDNEAMSELRTDGEPMRAFGGSSDLLSARKKRVTSHWKKFVQPIMWRCKWVELQLRKFQSLAIDYEKEIEKYNQTKHLKYGNFVLEDRCAKSMPFFHDSQREKPLKRKIRKNHEETDTEAFMSQHNLFSYFATCRSPPHVPTMDDDQPTPAPSTDKKAGIEFRVPDELLSLDFRDDYSLEQILWKIEVSQYQVSDMKNRINTVMTENEGRISSNEELLLHESNNVSVMESNFPTNMGGPTVVADFASQLMKLNTSDDLVKSDNLVKHENAVSDHGEETHFQDANGPVEELPVASRKRNPDGILIYNRRSKKPQTDSGPVKIHPIENLQVPKQENTYNTPPVSEDSSQNEQQLTPPKIRSVTKLSSPKNKKKRAARARRKPGSSLWTRRTQG